MSSARKSERESLTSYIQDCEWQDLLQKDKALLKAAVKGEVGLIQGHRLGIAANETEKWWEDEDKLIDAEGGDGEFTRVTQMIGKVNKLIFGARWKTEVAEEEEKEVTERVFSSLCWKCDIPYLPYGGRCKSDNRRLGIVKLSGGGGNTGGGGGGNEGNEQKSTTSKAGTSRKVKYDGGGGAGARGGDGGDDKKSDSDLSSTRTDATDTERATTTEAEVSSSKSSKPTKVRPNRFAKLKMRKKSLAGTIGDEEWMERSAQKKLWTDWRTPSAPPPVVAEETKPPPAPTKEKRTSQVSEISEPVSQKQAKPRRSKRAKPAPPPEVPERPLEKKPGILGKAEEYSEEPKADSAIISSVEQVEIEKEKGSQWMSGSSSSTEDVKDEAAKDEGTTLGGGEPMLHNQPVNPDLFVFMGSVKPLDNMTSSLGLNPFETKVVNKCVEVRWNPKSFSFVALCLITLFFCMVTLTILASMVLIYGFTEPTTHTQQIVQQDFANHFTECLSLACITFFMSIWGLSSVTELGIHNADFRTRFNVAVCLTNYDVSAELKRIIWKNIIVTGAFLGGLTLVFFGGRSSTSSVREAAGFIGYAILRPFNFHIRESIYFPLVEMFGLAVFIYSFLCLDAVILVFVVYGKGLENMARRFNLRLAYRLGKLCIEDENGKLLVQKRVIPYGKLYAEHLALSSLFQNFSQVNDLLLNGVLVAIGLEIMLIMFVIFEIFEPKTKAPSDVFIREVGSVQLAVPLRYVESRGELFMKAFALFCVTLLGFFRFGKIIHDAGNIMQVAIDYVRRHGLMLCATGKERRFIMSMINSMNPKAHLWIGKGFEFNRATMIGFLSFITAAAMVMSAFHPRRTALALVTHCDSQGQCSAFSARKTQLQRVYSAVNIPTEAPTLPPPEPPAPPPPGEVFIQPRREIFLQPLCLSGGAYPIVRTHSQSCSTYWNSDRLPSIVSRPHVYKRFAVTPTNSTSSADYFGRVTRPFVRLPPDSYQCQEIGDSNNPFFEENHPKLFCLSETASCNAFPYHNHFHSISTSIFDCWGKPVTTLEQDDCRSLKMTTIDSEGHRVEPRIRLMYTGNLEGVEEESILCCYDYYGGRAVGGTHPQWRLCNMPDAATMNEVCLFGVDRPRMTGIALAFHRFALSKVRVDKNYLDKNEALVKTCLCRLDGSEPPTKECEVPGVPPPILCTGGSALECSPTSSTSVKVFIPLLYRKDIKSQVEHIRYGPHCKGTPFKDSFYHDDSLSYGGTDLEDCSGKKIKRHAGDRDDCNNWHIRTPNVTDGGGRHLGPTPYLTEHRYNSKTLKVMDGSSSGDSSAFLCCFHYVSAPFQSNPSQLKYCNAPSIKAMNDGSWCGDNIGKSRPPPDLPAPRPQIHVDLLQKLPLVTGYSRQVHSKELLQDEVEQAKWGRCLCANLFQGLIPGDFDTAVKKCKADLRAPCEYLKEGLLQTRDVFPMCDHGWPKFTDKIMYPRLYTKPHGSWTAIQRYKSGSGADATTSNCFVDATYDDTIPLDGSTPLFDCFLNPITPADVDDCGTFGVETLSSGVPKSPRLQFVHVYSTMRKYDPSYGDPKAIFCCFNFADESDQGNVCNLPSAAAVKKRCGHRSKPEHRLKHEAELSKRVLLSNVYFKGNLVTQGNLAFTENQVWNACLCGGTSPDSKEHEECRKYYIPPCVEPKAASFIKLGETYTECPWRWGSGGPSFLRVPLVMENMKDGYFFKQLDRFVEGSTRKKCPEESAVDILSTSLTGSSKLSDCYGEELKGLSFDDCGSPNISTPKATSLRSRVIPVLQLIPADGLRGMDGDSRVYCCYAYGNAEEGQTKACNMPNLGAFKKHCEDKKSQVPAVVGFVETLKSRRASSGGDDVLKKGFEDKERKRWTQCVCYGNLGECGVAAG